MTLSGAIDAAVGCQVSVSMPSMYSTVYDVVGTGYSGRDRFDCTIQCNLMQLLGGGSGCVAQLGTYFIEGGAVDQVWPSGAVTGSFDCNAGKGTADVTFTGDAGVAVQTAF